MVSSSSAYYRHGLYFCKLLGEANQRYKNGNDGIDQGLSLLDQNIENIKRGQEWTAGVTEIDPRAAYLCSTYPDAGSFILNLRLHSKDVIQWRESALKASNILGLDQKVIAAHYTGLGKAYLDIGDFQHAEEYFKKSLMLHEESGNLQGLANTLGNLGIIYKHKGEFKLAGEYHKRSINIFDQLHDDKGTRNELGNIGTLYMHLGDPLKALSFFEQSLLFSQKVGDLQGQIISLFSIGDTLSTIGEHGRAIEILEQALAICEKINDPINKGKILGNLGNAYFRAGHYLKALQYYQITITSEDEMGNQFGIGKAYFNIAMCYASLNDFENAISNAEFAIQAFKKVKHPLASKIERQIMEWKKSSELNL